MDPSTASVPSLTLDAFSIFATTRWYPVEAAVLAAVSRGARLIESVGEAEARVQCGTKGRTRLMHAAAIAGHLPRVVWLLGRGAVVNERLVAEAAVAGHADVVCALLSHAPGVSTSQSLLALACAAGSVATVRALTGAGAVTTVDDLAVAVMWGRADVARVLLGDDHMRHAVATGATACGRASRSPLTLACARGDAVTAALLLDAGAPLTADGQATPLAAACGAHCVDPLNAPGVAVMLRTRRVAATRVPPTAVQAQDGVWRRLLGCVPAPPSPAARADTVTLLLDRGARVDECGPDGAAPLQHACSTSAGMRDVAARLVACGARPAAAHDGDTLMHVVARSEQPDADLIRELADAGVVAAARSGRASVDATTDVTGFRTRLELAAAAQSPRACALIRYETALETVLRRSATLGCVPGGARVLLELVRATRDAATRDALDDGGSAVDAAAARDAALRPVLDWGCALGRRGTVEVDTILVAVIDAGVEPSRADFLNACMRGFVDTVRACLAAGADARATLAPADAEQFGVAPGCPLLHAVVHATGASWSRVWGSADASAFGTVVDELVTSGADVDAVLPHVAAPRRRAALAPMSFATHDTARWAHVPPRAFAFERHAVARPAAFVGTALHVAAAARDAAMLSRLLRHGADANSAAGWGGATPLISVLHAPAGAPEAVEACVNVLLRGGADVRATTADGVTALACALDAAPAPSVGTSHARLIGLLVSAGADAGARSKLPRALVDDGSDAEDAAGGGFATPNRRFWRELPSLHLDAYARALQMAPPTPPRFPLITPRGGDDVPPDRWVEPATTTPTEAPAGTSPGGSGASPSPPHTPTSPPRLMRRANDREAAPRAPASVVPIELATRRHFEPAVLRLLLDHGADARDAVVDYATPLASLLMLLERGLDADTLPPPVFLAAAVTALFTIDDGGAPAAAPGSGDVSSGAAEAGDRDSGDAFTQLMSHAPARLRADADAMASLLVTASSALTRRRGNAVRLLLQPPFSVPARVTAAPRTRFSHAQPVAMFAPPIVTLSPLRACIDGGRGTTPAVRDARVLMGDARPPFTDGALAAATLLVEHGADVDEPGVLRLACAGIGCDVRVAALLLGCVADVGVADADGGTPLHELLLSASRAQRARGHASAPLLAAADADHAVRLNTASLLLAAPGGAASVRAQLRPVAAAPPGADAEGGAGGAEEYWARLRAGAPEAQALGTPLHVAALCGLPDFIELLVAAGADVNAPFTATARSADGAGHPAAGATPLHLAIAAEQLDAARALVRAGADAARRRADGLTATDAAAALPSSWWRRRFAAALADADPDGPVGTGGADHWEEPVDDDESDDGDEAAGRVSEGGAPVAAAADEAPALEQHSAGVLVDATRISAGAYARAVRATGAGAAARGADWPLLLLGLQSEDSQLGCVTAAFTVLSCPLSAAQSCAYHAYAHGRPLVATMQGPSYVWDDPVG